MANSETCPICGGRAKSSPIGSMNLKFDCLTCGNFIKVFELMCDEIPNDLRPYLSAATRQASEGGKPLTVMPDDLREIAEPHMGTTVSEKIDKLLSHVARKTHVPGRSLTIQYRYDYPLVDGLDEGELKDYLDYLVRQGLLRAEATGRGPSETAFKLTIDGWRQLEPALRPGGEPGRCFIASWLDDQMDEPYRKGVEPAVKDCGYRPVWMKDIPENKGITDRIKSEIRRAEFIVADFTGQRPSVYYESGFAQGLGREVIWCCREDELAKLHFDIRHLGHVVWRNPADLREKLADSIRANIIKQG